MNNLPTLMHVGEGDLKASLITLSTVKYVHGWLKDRESRFVKNFGWQKSESEKLGKISGNAACTIKRKQEEFVWEQHTHALQNNAKTRRIANFVATKVFCGGERITMNSRCCSKWRRWISARK